MKNVELHETEQPVSEPSDEEDTLRGENHDLLQKEELDNMINPIIFVRGIKNDCFYLILSGKVMICSGNEGFFLEQGAFNYMGVECLLNDTYLPDFSAKVIGKAKLLKISRNDYRKCLTHVQNNLRSIK